VNIRHTEEKDELGKSAVSKDLGQAALRARWRPRMTYDVAWDPSLHPSTKSSPSSTGLTLPRYSQVGLIRG
jgi:hypothetical protein